MNLMLHLNSFETKLKALGFFQKTQLYLIPFFTAIFIIFNYFDFKNQTIFEPKKVLEEKRIDTFEFLKQLEKFAFDNAITILNIKQNENTFTLEVNASFAHLLQFIYFCETYESVNIIERLKLTYHQTQSSLIIEFTLAQNIYEADKITHFASIKSALKSESTTKKSLQINAIVNNEALINNVWVTKEDMILGYKIIQIDKHFVVVQKPNEKEIVLKLIKE